MWLYSFESKRLAQRFLGAEVCTLICLPLPSAAFRIRCSINPANDIPFSAAICCATSLTAAGTRAAICVSFVCLLLDISTPQLTIG